MSNDTPTALTREQVEYWRDCPSCRNLRLTLAQQAQEIEALKEALDDYATCITQQQAELTTAQARVKELERNQCAHCGARLIDGCLSCGAPICCPQCCQIDHLRATLTAREARITALESAMREAFPMLNNTSDDDTELKERLRTLLNLHEE